MSKRIISLLLCFVFFCLFLSSCGKNRLDHANDYIKDHSKPVGREEVSLNFYIPCQVMPGEDTIASMEAAFNEMIKSYHTTVHFCFVENKDGTYKAYNEKLSDVRYAQEIYPVLCAYTDNAFAGFDKMSAEEQGSLVSTIESNGYVFSLTFGKTDKEDEILKKKITFLKEKVYDLHEKNTDIFLSTSYEVLSSYIADGIVADLTPYVKADFRSLCNAKSEIPIPGSEGELYHTTISEIIFSNAYYCREIFDNDLSETAAERIESYFGIPCNYVIGSETDASAYKYLYVRKETAKQFYMDDDFPADATSDAIKQSVQAAEEQLKNEIKQDTALTKAPEYLDSKIGMKYYVFETDNKQSYGARYTQAYGEESPVTYTEDDYYITVLSKPAVSYPELCANMLCVSADCPHIDRAYEVLFELNTNAKLHTVLQYGTPDVNFKWDEDHKVINLISDAPKYQMNPKDTGNAFCIYPVVTPPENPKDQEEAKAYADACVAGYRDLHYGYLQNKDVSIPAIDIHKEVKTRQNLYQAFVTLCNRIPEGVEPTTTEGVTVWSTVGEFAGEQATYTYTIKQGEYQITITREGAEMRLVAKESAEGGIFDILYYQGDATYIRLEGLSMVPSENYTFRLQLVDEPTGSGANIQYPAYSGAISPLSAENYTAATTNVPITSYQITVDYANISSHPFATAPSSDSTQTEIFVPFAVGILNCMLRDYSLWLSTSGSGLKLADFGFIKFQ